MPVHFVQNTGLITNGNQDVPNLFDEFLKKLNAAWNASGGPREEEAFFLLIELFDFDAFSGVVSSYENLKTILSHPALCNDQSNLFRAKLVLGSSDEAGTLMELIPNIDSFIQLIQDCPPVWGEWFQNYLFQRESFFKHLFRDADAVIKMMQFLPAIEEKMINHLCAHIDFEFFKEKLKKLFQLIRLCQSKDSKNALIDRFFCHIEFKNPQAFWPIISKEHDLADVFVYFLRSRIADQFISFIKDAPLPEYHGLSSFDLLAQSPWNQLNQKLMGAIEVPRIFSEFFKSAANPGVVFRKISNIDPNNSTVILELLKGTDQHILQHIFPDTKTLIDFMDVLTPSELDTFLLGERTAEFARKYGAPASAAAQAGLFHSPSPSDGLSLSDERLIGPGIRGAPDLDGPPAKQPRR